MRIDGQHIVATKTAKLRKMHRSESYHAKTNITSIEKAT